MLQKEQDALQDYVSRREKKSKPTLAIKMVHDMTRNLHLECKENKEHVQETQQIFGIPLNISNENEMNFLERHVRQVFVALALGVTAVATSLYSLFTTNQLVDIASSDNTDDIVEESNRVVSAISDMERRLLHNEKMQEKIGSHVKNLEKEFLLKRNIDEVVIHASSLQQLGHTIKQQLVANKNALLTLLNNKLPPELVDLNTMQVALNKLKDIIKPSGYQTILQNAVQILQAETSFVSFNNDMIVIIIHVPLVNKRNMMDLYEHRPMPIGFNEDNDTNYIINHVKMS